MPKKSSRVFVNNGSKEPVTLTIPGATWAGRIFNDKGEEMLPDESGKITIKEGGTYGVGVAPIKSSS